MAGLLSGAAPDGFAQQAPVPRGAPGRMVPGTRDLRRLQTFVTSTTTDFKN